MSKKRNFSKALSKYLNVLDIGDENRSTLTGVRKSVRAHLRQNFPIAKGKIKFMTQGSFRSKTINRPCSPPRQKMDLDDGIYIPKSHATAKAQELLAMLADAMGSHSKVKSGTWELVTKKPSCLRVIVGEDKHVDIPLYRVSDEEMENITSSVIEHDSLEHEIFGMKFIHSWVERGCVELVHKEHEWINSDPREIYDWFLQNVKKYGINYVHICRILKGWRDHQWQNKDSRLSSILIMRIVELVMEDLGDETDTPLDDLLNAVVAGIPDVMNKPITDPDPTRENEILNDFEEHEKQDCLVKFRKLGETLNDALYSDSAGDFMQKLYDEFGKFFPKDSNLCKALLPTAPAIIPAASANPTPRLYGG